jgi:hypothetical protein
MGARSPRGWVAFASATAAVALAGAFTYWALNEPMLMQDDDVVTIRIAIALPLVLTTFGWILLHLACRYDRESLRNAGAAVATVLYLLCLISGFSIGLLVMPAAAALLVAVALTPAEG